MKGQSFKNWPGKPIGKEVEKRQFFEVSVDLHRLGDSHLHIRGGAPPVPQLLHYYKAERVEISLGRPRGLTEGTEK